MEKLTAIVPTRNEAHNIDGALQSLAFADEIMVVDSYSTDATVEKARKYTDFIIQRKFDYHASQKNWAIPQATHEWILLLDADERITPALQVEIQTILANPGDDVAYWIYRDNEFMGRHLKHSGIQGDKCIRLFRKSLCRYDDKLVHEEIVAQGRVGSLKNRMFHNTYTTLDEYYSKINRYATLQSIDYSSKKRRISFYHLWIKPNIRFIKHYFICGGFMDGFPGYVFSLTRKHAVKMRYVKMKELQESNLNNESK